MVLVALAGGTSATLGRSLTTAILTSTSHTPIILSRAPKTGTSETPPPATTKYGAAIRYVDYTSHSSLAKALEGVHTLISLLNVPDEKETVSVHSNLLHAAKEAGVTRFAPSEWEGGPLSKEGVPGMLCKLEIWDLCLQSGMECARFEVGWFMNYLGQGLEGERGEEARKGLKDEVVLEYLDIGNGRVVVPVKEGEEGNGTPAKVTMTELGDIGRFVAAALDLPPGTWKADMSMVGDTVDFETIAKLAERVRGRKFEISYTTKKELKEKAEQLGRELKERYEEGKFLSQMCAQLMMGACEETVGNQVLEPVVNGLCPHVKPMGVKEYLEKYWSD